MSEQELRETLRRVCEDLDRRVRTVVRTGLTKVVAPVVLTAGLSLASCDSTGSEPTPDTIADAVTDASGDATPADSDLGPQPLYAAPFDGTSGDTATDAGPQPLYAAPFDGTGSDAHKDIGAQPLYAAPFDAG